MILCAQRTGGDDEAVALNSTATGAVVVRKLVSHGIIKLIQAIQSVSALYLCLQMHMISEKEHVMLHVLLLIARVIVRF
jgi:hypothetical protein